MEIKVLKITQSSLRKKQIQQKIKFTLDPSQKRIDMRENIGKR